MRISTLDPISMNDVTDTETAPYVIDGDLKIYFESEANKCEYLDTPLHGALNTQALNKVFDDASDSPITGSIN
jgi:YHS domain-containing protein